MRKIAYVARVRHDKESELRYYLDKAVPTAALAHAGIQGMEVFVGSGYCVMTLDYDGDFQAILERLMAYEDITEFRQKLAHVLDDFPAPGEEQPSGELPLAGEAFHWSPEPSQAI